MRHAPGLVSHKGDMRQMNYDTAPLLFVLQHVTKKRMCQNFDTPPFYYAGLTENRLVRTLEFEGHGQRVPYTHGLTVLTTRSELGQ